MRETKTVKCKRCRMKNDMIRKIRESSLRMPPNIVLAARPYSEKHDGTAKHLLKTLADRLEQMPVPERIEEERAETKILRRAITTYGAENQIWQMLEELFELGLAICKLRREKNKERYKNFVEERADVRIMLEQMDLIYEDGMDVADMREYKIDRLENRLDKEENDEICD